jgi:hypothetical protein
MLLSSFNRSRMIIISLSENGGRKEALISGS